MPNVPRMLEAHHACGLPQVRPGGLAAFAVDAPAGEGQAEEEGLVVMVELQRGRKPAPEEVDELIALVRRTVRCAHRLPLLRTLCPRSSRAKCSHAVGAHVVAADAIGMHSPKHATTHVLIGLGPVRTPRHAFVFEEPHGLRVC